MKKILSKPCFYFLLTIFCVAFVEPQQFSDELRFAIYCIPILIGFVFIFYQKKNHLNTLYKSPITADILLFYIISTIILIIHGDFLKYGLGQLSYFIFVIISLWERDEDEINEEVSYISMLLIAMNILMTVINFTVIPLFRSNPQLYEGFSERNCLLIDGIITQKGTRMNGIFGHPNKTGNFAAISFISSIYLFFKAPSIKWKILSVISVMTTLLTLILTGSRTAMLMIGIFSIFFFVLLLISGIWKERKDIKKSLLSITIIGVIFVLIFAAILALNKNYRNVFINTIIRINSIENASGRDWIHKEAIHLGLENPLFGISQIKLSEIIGVDAHNSYLQVFATSGIPCFILYIIFILFSIYASLKTVVVAIRKKETNKILLSIFLLSALTAIFAENFFERMLFCLFFTPGFYGYYIIGANIILWSKNKEHKY